MSSISVKVKLTSSYILSVLMLSGKIHCNNDSNESCLALQPPKNLSHFFNEFNCFSSNINNIPENTIDSNYYDINQLQTTRNLLISLSLFHLNTWSLSKKTSDGLEPLTQSTKTDFDIKTSRLILTF